MDSKSFDSNFPYKEDDNSDGFIYLSYNFETKIRDMKILTTSYSDSPDPVDKSILSQEQDTKKNGYNKKLKKKKSLENRRDNTSNYIYNIQSKFICSLKISDKEKIECNDFIIKSFIDKLPFTKVMCFIIEPDSTGYQFIDILDEEKFLKTNFEKHKIKENISISRDDLCILVSGNYKVYNRIFGIINYLYETYNLFFVFNKKVIKLLFKQQLIDNELNDGILDYAIGLTKKSYLSIFENPKQIYRDITMITIYIDFQRSKPKQKVHKKKYNETSLNSPNPIVSSTITPDAIKLYAYKDNIFQIL